ncbi:MAG: QueT transporter family protein [Ruminococcaceae bacterium]|nr:QueT transporter family protein [Oscillospiraceae bacterium]
MKQSIKNLTHAAIIAALYVVLTHLQNFLLPGTTSAAIQFRLSEALCVFALFTPSAIWGLSIGCFIYNISYFGALPLDFFIGTAATALATMAMYQFRNLKVLKLPVLSLAMPAVFNALLVGWELSVYIGGSFLLNAAYVAIGEAAVLFTLGIALYALLSNRRLNSLLFGR